VSTTLSPATRRPPPALPPVHRAGAHAFRRVARAVAGAFRGIGQRGYYLRDIGRAFADPATYASETIRQMRTIGVDSLPLVVIVAGFLGAVSAFQSFYQLFAGVEYSVLSFLVRQSVVLELGPLLTALVLCGRVGARMTAEIGTMRVTEQIDALETLAYDPIAYLTVPRLLAAIVMVPTLVLVANFMAIVIGWVTLLAATPVTSEDYIIGLRFGFKPFQVVYGLIKAVSFGAAIAFVGTYEGYTTGAGAEGVGRSTARTVVFASVSILVLDAVIAAALATYIAV
jgi:phospholipid/cholesterol/gamma-HCH transport system permease protein